MQRSFSQMQRDAEQIARHGKVYGSGIPYKYNYNLINSGNNNHNPSLKPDIEPIGDYNYKRPKPDIVKVIKTDPVFKQATLEWGMWIGPLVNACKEFGVERVKYALVFVSSIEDRYFRDDTPINKQRGAYAMTVIRNGCLEAL